MTQVTLHIDPTSIERGVKRLKEYRNRTLQDKIDRMAKGAVEAFIQRAKAEYGGYAGAIEFSTHTSSTKDRKTWTITVSSPGLITRDGEMLPLVVFLEFGTGFYTDPGAEYADDVPVDVYAGSWSKGHARTYQEWIELGKDPAKYPYNHYAVQAVFHGMESMREYVSKYRGR